MDGAATRPGSSWELPFVAESSSLVPVPVDPLAALLDGLVPGTTLKGGRYRLVQQFVTSPGLQPQGGEPPLMIAMDTQLGERVLIQELRLASALTEDVNTDMDTLRKAIARRFETLAGIAGTAKLIDHFAERLRHFLVFELPSGDVLVDRIARTKGGLDESAAIGYALQVLDILTGFAELHPAFIHGNITPAHIVLRPSGQVMLVGYSAALLMHPTGAVAHGPAGGVPGYAPPEQIRGSASTATDLFAVCAMLHHAVTGMAPAPRSTALHPPARHLNPNVSLELEDVLSRGLRPSATQRFYSIAELRAALQPLASGRRRTHVPDELRVESRSPALAPVRDARGRLVLPRTRATQSPLVLLAIVLALVGIVGGGMLYVLSARSSSGSGGGVAVPTPNEIAQLVQSQGIGLSGGEFIFDSTRSDNDAKQRGAQALAGGDVTAALTAFQEAKASDPADAEAAIYAADAQILKDHSPYVTVVAALAFAGDDAVAAARSELQGVFLAQQHINSLDVLSGGLRLRVLILNSGQTADGATTAAGLLLHEIQLGNTQHLAGIIGWPESEQTRLAISALAASGLAILSPTANDDHLGGYAGHFFALTPSASDQAAELADAAINQIGVRDLLVASDPQDQANAAVAASFISRARHDAPNGLSVHAATFSTGQLKTYDAVAHSATFAPDTLIFLAGTDQDAVYLAQSVRRLNTADGTSYRILVGSNAYTAALFGLGNSTLAKTARTNPAALATLYVTSLADVRDFAALGLGNGAASSFADPYAQQFGPNAEPSGLDAPDATAILSFDATRVLLAAFSRDTQVASKTITYATPNQIRARLLQYDSAHPFMGVGGAIAFTITGSEPVKALAVDTLLPVSSPASGAPIAHTSVYLVIGGQLVFCGQASCTPAG
jgi:serine/threonine protein kinase